MPHTNASSCPLLSDRPSWTVNPGLCTGQQRTASTEDSANISAYERARRKLERQQNATSPRSAVTDETYPIEKNVHDVSPVAHYRPENSIPDIESPARESGRRRRLRRQLDNQRDALAHQPRLWSVVAAAHLPKDQSRQRSLRRPSARQRAAPAHRPAHHRPRRKHHAGRGDARDGTGAAQARPVTTVTGRATAAWGACTRRSKTTTRRTIRTTTRTCMAVGARGARLLSRSGRAGRGGRRTRASSCARTCRPCERTSRRGKSSTPLRRPTGGGWMARTWCMFRSRRRIGSRGRKSGWMGRTDGGCRAAGLAFGAKVQNGLGLTL